MDNRYARSHSHDMDFGDPSLDNFDYSVINDLIFFNIRMLVGGDIDEKFERYNSNLDYPSHIAMASVDFEFQGRSTGNCTEMAYDNAQDMQTQLLQWVETIITPPVLECVRNGKIKNFTVSIGPISDHNSEPPF